MCHNEWLVKDQLEMEINSFIHLEVFSINLDVDSFDGTNLGFICNDLVTKIITLYGRMLKLYEHFI